jgi:hypothetical protein
VRGPFPTASRLPAPATAGQTGPGGALRLLKAGLVSARVSPAEDSGSYPSQLSALAPRPASPKYEHTAPLPHTHRPPLPGWASPQLTGPGHAYSVGPHITRWGPGTLLGLYPSLCLFSLGQCRLRLSMGDPGKRRDSKAPPPELLETLLPPHQSDIVFNQ